VDICFSGGLFGPDGTQRYLGKWCKRGQNGESTSTKGNLISVGADGRGGKVKVLRSPSQAFSVSFVLLLKSLILMQCKCMNVLYLIQTFLFSLKLNLPSSSEYAYSLFI
jgi:hypothetical protein